MAVAIARAMKNIHDKQKDHRVDNEQNYYSHRHLSSYNIVIAGLTNNNGILKSKNFESMRVLIADMNSEVLKKYAKLFMNYQNYNAWSPPELYS